MACDGAVVEATKGRCMGAFDQAARFAAQSDPDAVPRRVQEPTGLLCRSASGWTRERSRFPAGPTAPPISSPPLMIPPISPPGSDRTADLVAALDDPTHQPALVVFEL
jgi:hypothetical protein